MTSTRPADALVRNENGEPPAAPHRFLVTSRGASATRWLCFALASQADVFVAHGKHALQSIQQGRFDDERRQDDTASLALGNVMSDFYRCRSLDEVFDIYRYLQPGAQASGNVHTYQLDEVRSRFESQADLADIRIVNVIRHPVTYIASHIGMMRSARRYAALLEPWHVEFAKATEQHPDLLEIERAGAENFEAFVVSCQSVAQWTADLENRSVAHIKMEDMTRDVDCLVWICEYLTRLPYDRKRLAGFIQDGPINRHRQATAPVTPLDVYRQWEPWQRTAAALILPDELLEQLEAEGYDVAMLKSEDRKSVQLAEAGRRQPAAEATPPAADHDSSMALPLLVDEGYRGFNTVLFQERYIALAQALGPVDLLQVSPAWWTTSMADRALFIGESLLDVQRQVDQLTISRVLEVVNRTLEQVRATGENPIERADAGIQGDTALEHIRNELESLVAAPGCADPARETWLENLMRLLQENPGTTWLRCVHVLRHSLVKLTTSSICDHCGRKAA